MRRLARSFYYLIFKNSPDVVMGKMLCWVLPHKTTDDIQQKVYDASIKRGYFTRCILRAKESKFYSLSDAEKQSFLLSMWGGAFGNIFFNVTKQMGIDKYLRTRSLIVNFLKRSLEKNGSSHILEIGTGNGLFLQYLASIVPDGTHCVGIDINKDQIAKNASMSIGKCNLTFYCGSVERWLSDNAHSRVIVVACGTLMSFTQSQIESMLKTLYADRTVEYVCISEGVHESVVNHKDSLPGIGLFNHYHDYKHIFMQNKYAVLEEELIPPPSDTPRGHTYWTAIAQPLR